MSEMDCEQEIRRISIKCSYFYFNSTVFLPLVSSYSLSFIIGTTTWTISSTIIYHAKLRKFVSTDHLLKIIKLTLYLSTITTSKGVINLIDLKSDLYLAQSKLITEIDLTNFVIRIVLIYHINSIWIFKNNEFWSQLTKKK